MRKQSAPISGDEPAEIAFRLQCIRFAAIHLAKYASRASGSRVTKKRLYKLASEPLDRFSVSRGSACTELPQGHCERTSRI